ncbi:MAG: hypothetical protein LBO65_05230 [Spirochaetaceae bacterium]|jgi:hypothetical protein|nr:hypothetical protein [Spirochaetaceae bacterium]
MEYNLNGKVSLDDYIQFNKFYQKHGFFGKLRILFFLALCVFLALAILPNLDALIDVFKESPLGFIKIFMPVIICLIVFIVFNTVVQPLIYKKHYNANKMLQQNQNIKINEQFISVTTEKGNNKLTKSDINKIKCDKDSVYIFLGLNIVNILKKGFLDNPSDFEDMVNFIKLNYGKK